MTSSVAKAISAISAISARGGRTSENPIIRGILENVSLGPLQKLQKIHFARNTLKKL
jgi:hypothetical protein